MDQQDRGAKATPPPADKVPAQGRSKAKDSANDSTWGLGSASAMDNLRRHGYGVRHDKPADEDDRPRPE
jgi:hypothetical protein